MPKVLIADDSMAVRKVAERLLVQAGLEVALASSGEEALAWLAKERADVIISDVIMPGLNGPDVYEQISQVAGTSTTVTPMRRRRTSVRTSAPAHASAKAASSIRM